MSYVGSRCWDVIVAGSGPAGSTLARELASKGVDVLMLERATHPREKTCAGGVTVRASSLLPFDISEVVEDTITGAELTLRLASPVSKSWDRPITHTVSRARFDHLLCQQATSAGAGLLEGHAIVGATLEEDSVSVKTSDGTFRARFLVGADGANGVVARAIGLAQSTDMHIGFEAKAVVAQSVMPGLRGKVFMDFGMVPGGYAWAFPKSDHVSIGAGGPRKYTHRLRTYVARMAERLGCPAGPAPTGYPMPLRKSGQPMTNGRCLLIGDATGLIDPFTGEGLHSAIKSALLAVPVIIKALGEPDPSLADYERAVDSQISPDLRISRGFARMTGVAPGIFHRWFRDDPRVWRVCCRLLRGEVTPRDMARQVGPLRLPLWLAAR